MMDMMWSMMSQMKGSGKGKAAMMEAMFNLGAQSWSGDWSGGGGGNGGGRTKGSANFSWKGELSRAWCKSRKEGITKETFDYAVEEAPGVGYQCTLTNLTFTQAYIAEGASKIA